jgi:signal transduction histidine kinase
MDTSTTSSTSAPTDKAEQIDFFLLTAHELRTSLTAMKWAFKMLIDGDYGPLTIEQKNIIEQLVAGNAKNITTLNAAMTALKGDSAVTYIQSPFDLSTCIASLLKEFASEAKQKNIVLSLHPSPAPLIIVGDETKLCMAFHNVIENALKYSGPGSEVVVTVSHDDARATLSIRDHGIGVPADKLPHLFEKFFRAGNSTESGTGLGLYGSKFIIERHGGSITLESQEHIGSTVTISLPLHS